MKARPPILFTVAFGAGLATGLLHFWAPVCVAVVLLGWMAVSGGGSAGPTPAPPAASIRAVAGLLAAAATLGGVEAAVALAREAQACAVRLPAGTLSLRVRLLEPIDSAGGQVRVRPVSAGCEGDVTARWPAAHAADAGAEARVTARWIARPQWSGRGDGTLVVSGVHASGASVLASGAAERLRSWATTAARRLYGPRAELVEALVLGRRVGLEPALRDDFAQSGLIHLLSISGFHVGLVAAWVALACRAAGMRRERALLAAAGTAVLYVSFLGWPAPATRAALLAVLAAWCRQRQRNVRANPLLSATCLAVMLIDPWAVLDLGAWLSAGALWGAATATRWSDRALGTSWGWRALSSSIGATLATAPLTAAALGTVAPIGIALNFAAIPLAAVAVPGVFASLLLLPFAPDAAASLAAGAGLGLHLIELLAAVGAAVPGGHVVTEAGPGAAVPWLLALAAFLWGMHARTTRAEALRRWAWVGAFALWIPLALQLGRPAAYGPSDLTLHFLDVGQGDGAVLRTPRGHYVVVDAGPAGGHGAGGRADAGRRVLVPFLAREGVAEISAMIVSHAHADHVGGAAAVLDRFHTDLVIEPGERYADPVYYHFLDAVAADGVPWRPGRPGDRFTLDGVSFTLLHPNPAWPHWGEDLNEDSVVLLVQYGGFRALLPGDAGLVAEHWLAGRAGRVDFLKVGHHGSRGATGDAWLDELHPKAAVVSVGTHNTYGHPSAEALARLRAHGVAVWRTDQDGQVDVVTDGATMTVQSRTRRQVFSVQDSLDGR